MGGLPGHLSAAVERNAAWPVTTHWTSPNESAPQMIAKTLIKLAVGAGIAKLVESALEPGEPAKSRNTKQAPASSRASAKRKTSQAAASAKRTAAAKPRKAAAKPRKRAS